MTAVDIFCSAASVLLLSLCDSSDLCKCAVNLDRVNSCSVPFYKRTTSIISCQCSIAFVIVFKALTHYNNSLMTVL